MTNNLPIQLHISNSKPLTSGTLMYLDSGEVTPPQAPDFSYRYTDQGGNSIGRVIPLMHKNRVNIRIVDTTGMDFTPFACIVSSADTGGIINYFMLDDVGYDVAQSVPKTSHVFSSVTMPETMEVQLDVDPSIVAIMRRVCLTVFVKNKPQEGENTIIIPCDPEFDSDGED